MPAGESGQNPILGGVGGDKSIMLRRHKISKFSFVMSCITCLNDLPETVDGARIQLDMRMPSTLTSSIPTSKRHLMAPRGLVAMLDRSRLVAVGRPGADAGQHGLGALEYLTVEIDANWRPVDAAAECAGLPRRRLMDVVDGAPADEYAH